MPSHFHLTYYYYIKKNKLVIETQLLKVHLKPLKPVLRLNTSQFFP